MSYQILTMYLVEQPSFFEQLLSFFSQLLQKLLTLADKQLPFFSDPISVSVQLSQSAIDNCLVLNPIWMLNLYRKEQTIDVQGSSEKLGYSTSNYTKIIIVLSECFSSVENTTILTIFSNKYILIKV